MHLDHKGNLPRFRGKVYLPAAAPRQNLRPYLICHQLHNSRSATTPKINATHLVKPPHQAFVETHVCLPPGSAPPRSATTASSHTSQSRLTLRRRRRDAGNRGQEHSNPWCYQLC